MRKLTRDKTLEILKKTEENIRKYIFGVYDNDIQEICNWLGHGLNSTQVCQKLHMCNNTFSHTIC